MIAGFGQKNASWAWETIALGNEYAFTSCEKYIVLWARTIFVGLEIFILHSPNMRLQNDNSVTKIFTTKLQKDISNSEWLNIGRSYSFTLSKVCNCLGICSTVAGWDSMGCVKTDMWSSFLITWPGFLNSRAFDFLLR